MKNIKLFEEFSMNEATTKDQIKKIVDYLFGSQLMGADYAKLSKAKQDEYDNAPWQADCEKVNDYFNDLGEDGLEKFADETGLSRKVSIEDLTDFSCSEWPSVPQEKAVEYLLKHKLIDANGHWINK